MFSTKGKSEMSVTCSKCGSKFNYQAQFCEKCGANIAKENAIKDQKHLENQHSLNTKLQGGIQIISVIEIAIGLFGLFIGAMLTIVSPFIPDFIKSTPAESLTYSDSLLQFFVVIGLVFGVLILVVSGLTIFFGYKLYNLENSGRFGSMIIASISLLMVPFGTVFGIISLVLLTKPEVIEIIRDRNNYL